MKANPIHVARERLIELLDYDQMAGVFTWKKNSGKRRLVGLVAGSTSHARWYRIISVDKCKYLAHRLAWFFVYGREPDGEIDHIDGDPDNNRIANLRECSRTENAQNCLRDYGKTSKYPGVSFDKARGKWAAKIRIGGGRRVTLGRFEDEAAAAQAYLAAKARLHPFTNFGRWSPAVYPAGWERV